MFGNNVKDPLAMRRAGVRTAQNESGTAVVNGEPQKLLSTLKAEVLFVRYTNERGNEEVGMFFKTEDGQYVTATDSVEWCKRLGSMSGWLEKQVNATLEEKATPLAMPADDTVDILPS